MAGVYSTRFVYTGGPGVWGYYLVPSGHRAVVRNLVMQSVDGPCTFYSSVGGAYLYIDSLTGPLTSRSIDLRQVAYGGEQIGIMRTTNSGAAVISGYLFREVLGINTDAPVPVPGDPPALYA